MLYVLRLSSGDCMITAAEDEQSARAVAEALKLADGETIHSVRPLPRLAVRLSPTDNGSLEVDSWDDSTLDDILGHEYPRLNEALQRANSVPFAIPSSSKPPNMGQLLLAHEQNAAIIREGLRRELERLNPGPIQAKERAAGE